MYNYLSIQKGQTVLEQKEILSKLKKLKPTYEKEGLILLGLFGSYAKETQNSFSDIDIAYKLDYDKFSQNFFLEYKSIKNHTRSLIDSYNVAANSINGQIKNLSGGNIQKLILGGEISERPSLLVASHPTYGLDVGATEYLREQLLKRRREGGAVLLFSEDLDEIFELCDRIAVMFQGEFTGILDSSDIDKLADIGLMMAGSVRY